jgi:hypothetical protein
MTRTVLTYGLIAGLISIVGIIASMSISDGHGASSLLIGYLIMLVALSSILVGVKQHRDRDLGGVIRFWPALGMGLAIALVASLAYVAVWELYLAATHYSFAEGYAAQTLASKRAAGVTGAAYQQAVAEMEAFKRQYADPLYRMPMTFVELFPIGLLVALVTAALVRNAKFLPARSAPARS